jgi:RHS repeat-associated protein
VNSAGVVQNHRKYDSFGNLTSQSDAGITTRFGYTGREFDPDTGLYFYRSRYYDPLVGRFISEDSIGFEAGDTNLYRYVRNSPVNYTDPFGFKGFPPVKPLPKTPIPIPVKPTPKIPFLPGFLGALGGILIDLVFPESLDDPEFSDPNNTCPDNRNCKDKKKKTCDDWPYSNFPKINKALRNIYPDGYNYNSLEEALGKIKKELIAYGFGSEANAVQARGMKPATQGPCVAYPLSFGTHWNVNVRPGANNWASIGKCTFCEDTLKGPETVTLYAVLKPRPPINKPKTP